MLASKWMLRQDAIKSITAFLESGGLTDSKDLVTNCCSLLIVVGEHTRAFKETNVNIMKAIIALFAALCDLHEGFEKPIGSWVMKSGVDASVSKIADKKLSSGCKSLLTKICVVHHPHHVLLEGFKILKKAKSPLAHEEFLVWIGKSFCSEFGAASVGSGLTDIIPSLLEVRRFVAINKTAFHLTCLTKALISSTGSFCFKCEGEAGSFGYYWYTA